MTIRKGALKPLTLIDDDEFCHVIFKAIMKNRHDNIPVVTYSRPLEVIDTIKSGSFSASAIILDINMPVMNGWEFLRQLSAFDVHIPVYMLSSSDDWRDKKRASEFGNVLDYFVKPLRNVDLDRIVKAIVSAP